MFDNITPFLITIHNYCFTPAYYKYITDIL